MKVTLLGTSGGIALEASNVDRAGPAMLVDMHGDLLLFDAGRSALQNLIRSGHSPAAIDRLFITHLHSNNIIGLPDLVLSSWVGHGKDHWQVYGPPGTRRLVDSLFGPGGAFDEDIRIRTSKESQELLQARIGKKLIRPTFEVTEVTEEGILCNGHEWEVVASLCPKHSQPALGSLAYKVIGAQGSVVITGDTGPHADVAKFAKGCSVLLHDCTIKDRTGYENRLSHTDPKSLGWVAALAEPKLLIGYGIALRADHPEILATFARLVAENYSGRFVLAKDLLRVDVAAAEILP